MLMCVTILVLIHPDLGGAGLGSPRAGKLSAMRLFLSVFSFSAHFGKWGEQTKDGNPRSAESAGAAGSHHLQSLLHPVHRVSRESAELFTHKHPGMKPPPQGKGGWEKSKQREHEKLIGF